MKTQNFQMSESYLIGMLLAVTGGFLDVYTYILRGHVFANAQTGNIVLLAIKLSEGDFKAAGIYLIPIAAFIAGVLIAEYTRKKLGGISKLHWRQAIILFEISIILLVSFIPVGPMNDIVNILVAFVSSLQVQAFRKVNGNAYATTMCTGNLRSASEELHRFIQYKDKIALGKSAQYYGIILFFIIGAFLGSIATNIYGNTSTLFCFLLLLVVFFLMFKRGKLENL
jgi:uncharacterized membrane protein YoaK (UPF0700 family)